MSAIEIVNESKVSESAKKILLNLIESWGGFSDVEYEQSFHELVNYIANLEQDKERHG